MFSNYNLTIVAAIALYLPISFVGHGYGLFSIFSELYEILKDQGVSPTLAKIIIGISVIIYIYLGYSWVMFNFK